jgi:hypothetical protein
LTALFLVVFAVGFVLAAYVTGPAAEAITRDPTQLSGLRHWGGIGLWIFGAGLFFFGMRALQINPLSFAAPIWIVLSTIAALIFIIRCASWWRTTYPTLLARDANLPTANSQ